MVGPSSLVGRNLPTYNQLAHNSNPSPLFFKTEFHWGSLSSMPVAPALFSSTMSSLPEGSTLHLPRASSAFLLYRWPPPQTYIREGRVYSIAQRISKAVLPH
jgi:hypothetical protein